MVPAIRCAGSQWLFLSLRTLLLLCQEFEQSLALPQRLSGIYAAFMHVCVSYLRGFTTGEVKSTHCHQSMYLQYEVMKLSVSTKPSHSCNGVRGHTLNLRILMMYKCICITHGYSQVYQVSANQVLQQEAYLLFYARDLEYQPPASPVQPKPLVSPNLPQTKGTVDHRTSTLYRL